MVDFQQLNDFLSSRVLEVLQDIIPEGKLVGKEYTAASKLGGKGESFKYNIQKMIGSDFATDETFGDLIGLNASIKNISQFDSAKELAEKYCPQILNSTSSPNNDKNFPNMFIKGLGNPYMYWCYRDINGNPIVYVARYNDKHGKKTFKPFRFNGSRWEQKAAPTPRPLYNLQELFNRENDPVLIVEGEKCADNAIERLSKHYVVTTWTNGASSVKHSEWSMLYKKEVYIWPDADKPGRDAAQEIADILLKNGSNVYIVNTDSLDESSDIFDYKDDAYKFIINNAQIAIQSKEDIVKGRDIDITLKYAKTICDSNTLAYDETIDMLYEYSDGYYQPIKHGKRNSKIDKMIISCSGGSSLSVAQRGNVIKNIQTLSYVNEDKFNSDFINFNNALYNPDTGLSIPHTKDVYSVNRIPYNYDAKAECPMWINFLNMVLNEDQNKIDILQEFIGYCFIKTCKYEKALFLPGGGQNGKGTFTSVIVSLFGGKANVSAANIEQIADDVKRSAILNKYVNIDTEIPKRAERYESAFKQAVSGEEMLFNEKYIAPYSKAPHCKLIFSTNKMPRIDEGTMGFYRRLLIIPFNRQISEKEKDIDLKMNLKKECPGIFNWAMIGLKRLKLNKQFTHDDDVVDTVEELRKDNNPILQFVDEMLLFHGNYEIGVTKKNLHKEYQSWCLASGHKPLSFRKFNTEFYEEFRNKTEKDKQYANITSRDRYWPGISRINAQEFGEVFNDENSAGWDE